MKKLLLVLCLLLTLTCLFAACDEGGEGTPTPDGAQNEEQNGETPEDEDTPEDEETPAPHSHTWSAWATTQAATCTAKGSQKRTCACGESETQALPATGGCVYNTQNVCTVCNTALQVTEGLEYTLNSDGESYTVSMGTALNNTTDIVIPWYYEEKPVTGIGYQAFYNTALTSITIPASVTSIGEEAFYSCDSLERLTIPASVTSIGEYAFEDCSNLTSVTFGENSQCTSIGNYAFWCCESLTSITIPSGVMSIGYSAFENCTKLTSITIPSGVTSIGSRAFSFCSSLASIVVESGNTVYHSAGNCLIKTASKTLIAGCKNSVIPTDGSVTSIGDWAFYSCYSLTSITIPASVTSIGASAFEECSSLTSITIPSSVTRIGEWAFNYCNKLTSVTFENTMGWWVFIPSTATSGTAVDVSEPTNNDDLLKDTYVICYWKRTV